MIYFLIALGLIFLLLPQLVFRIVSIFNKEYKTTQASLLMIRLIGFVIVLIILGIYLYNSIF